MKVFLYFGFYLGTLKPLVIRGFMLDMFGFRIKVSSDKIEMSLPKDAVHLNYDCRKDFFRRVQEPKRYCAKTKAKESRRGDQVGVRIL